MKTTNGKPLQHHTDALPHTCDSLSQDVSAACNRFFRNRGMRVGRSFMDFRRNKTVPQTPNQKGPRK